MSPKRRKEGHERHREDSRTRHDSDPGNLIFIGLAVRRSVTFEGEARLKASHGIRDRTSKGKARFQSLLGKRAPTGSDTPISWMKANVFYWNREMCRSIPLFTLPSRDSLPWVRIRSWKRMQYISSSSSKAKGQEKLNRKEKNFCYWLVGRDQRIKGFVPGKSGFTYLLYDIDWSCQKRRTWKSFLLTRLDCAKAVPLIQLWLASRIR